MLIGARFVQGAGGAIASAVILGMIVTMFPEPREQAKAIGVYSFVASAGASIGLLAGGVLTEAINWHWIFFVNVPIGIATALLAVRLVEDRPGIGLREGADFPGALLLTAGLMLGVYTLLEAGEQGWGSAQTLGLGGVAIALVAGFIARQAHVANPLMPLRLFRSRNVAGANLVMALLVVGFFGMFFLGALYLQGILGYSPLEVGLAFLPACLVMGTLSLGYAERIIMGIGPRAALIAGLVFSGAGLLAFARSPVDGNYAVDLLAVMLLLGAGAGTCFPALMTLAMSGATRSDSGLASGLVNTTVQVGGAIGLAVLATVASERTDALRADGEARAAALNAGYHLAYLIGAAAIVVAIVVAVVVVRSQAGATAGDEAHADAGPDRRGARLLRGREGAFPVAAPWTPRPGYVIANARFGPCPRGAGRARSVPAGFVTTYGDLCPAAPRFAGAVMAACEDPKVPWQRVVRADGSLAKGARQRRLLEAEGIPFRGERVDLELAWFAIDDAAAG